MIIFSPIQEIIGIGNKSFLVYLNSKKVYATTNDNYIIGNINYNFNNSLCYTFKKKRL